MGKTPFIKWTKDIVIQYLRDEGVLASNPDTPLPQGVEGELPSMVKRLNGVSRIRKHPCGIWEDQLLKKEGENDGPTRRIHKQNFRNYR